MSLFALASGFYKAADFDPALMDAITPVVDNDPVEPAIAQNTYWVGGNDTRLHRFENSYPLINGMAYNSYLILDEKTALIDTMDALCADEFFAHIAERLEDRTLDYVIVNHMEPDHSATLGEVLNRWPQAQVVCTSLAAKFIGQFFDPKLRDRCIIAAEGDILVLGNHVLSFVEAPWVHWPEVMMTYDRLTHVLFTADAFGTFGSHEGSIFHHKLDLYAQNSCYDEARRFYCNIVGKYGSHVQAALKKIQTLDIATVASTHGPIFVGDFEKTLQGIDAWSSYTPESNGVAIFCGSVYGHTFEAVRYLEQKLNELGVENVTLYDAGCEHKSFLLADAFKCSHLVCASITYNNKVFSAMRDFLADLQDHHLQSRHVSFIENGSWHANSAKLMRSMFESMPDMVEVGEAVSLKSRMTEDTRATLDNLAQAIAASLAGDTTYEKRLSDPLPAADTVSGASRH
ncbi:MAG: MBL fold metallo-hydrolase [Coriobacteriales bacterium]|nr:MBL fold metallo-hydrolase [Coriobacteriales bacterium]